MVECRPLPSYNIDHPDYFEPNYDICPTKLCCDFNICLEDLICTLRALLPAGELWRRTEIQQDCNNCGLCLNCQSNIDCSVDKNNSLIFNFFDSNAKAIECLLSTFCKYANIFDPLLDINNIRCNASQLNIKPFCDGICPPDNIPNKVIDYILWLKLWIYEKIKYGLVVANYSTFEMIANRFGIHLDPVNPSDLSDNLCDMILDQDKNDCDVMSTRLKPIRNAPALPIDPDFDYPQRDQYGMPENAEEQCCKKIFRKITYKMCNIEPVKEAADCLHPTVVNIDNYAPQLLPCKVDKLYLENPRYFDSLRIALECILKDLMPVGVELCLINCCDDNINRTN